MGRRRYKRLRIALPVTVSGHDTGGHTFTQGATTMDISVQGLRLRGLRHLLAPGDPVIVEYKERRARYRVAWIGQQGTCWEGLVGLDGLNGARLMFAEFLSPEMQVGPDANLDPFPAQAVPAIPRGDHAAVERRGPERRQRQERRRYVRYNCAGTARFWEEGNELTLTGRVNEISMGGCYIEIMAPLRVGALLRLELELKLRTIRVHGVVRSSQAASGMGIELTRMTPFEAEKLHRVIAELSGETEPAPSPAEQLETLGSNGLGEAVLRWFGTHDVLTRQQLLDLLEELKRAAEPVAHV
jgi:c-di-GMP-binding flagellar brake protein YcgR